MEHVVDLDRAAARITARIPRWREAGLMVTPLTWWDQLAPWPQPLETDRARVEIPASVGSSSAVARRRGTNSWQRTKDS